MNTFEKLEQSFKKLIDDHIITRYEKSLFYYLEIPNYPFLEILVDATFSNKLIKIVGESNSFSFSKTENAKKAISSHILANNMNNRIIGNENMTGAWIFEAIPEASTEKANCNATGKFTFVATLPNNATTEVMAEFLATAIDTFLITLTSADYFCDTPEEQITDRHLGFTNNNADSKTFLNPAFEAFIKNYGNNKDDTN